MQMPARAIQGAYQVGWIKDQKGWSEMIDNRNLTVHVYDKKIAVEVSAFVRARGHALLKDLAASIRPK